MEKFTKILETIDGYVWGIPLIVLIMAVGIFLTFRLRLLQIFHLPKALKFMFQNENGGKGEISSFAALCTALSATIGTGNIVGVATAIGVLSGGPGAFFTASKATLAISSQISSAGLGRLVLQVAFAIISNSSFTTPALMLVPPRSIPM